MRHLLNTLLLGLLFASPAAFATSDGIRDFNSGSFPTLVEAREGEPFLLVLWSVECPPCFREFDVFRELREEGIEVPLVLVATDRPDQRVEVQETLERFDLTDVETWHFANPDASRLRYEIDPNWYGEMPRSYYYAADGSRHGHSGGLKREQIEEWLAAIAD